MLGACLFFFNMVACVPKSDEDDPIASTPATTTSGTTSSSVTTDTANYQSHIYEQKTYKVERDPGVNRNGFGMDFYHYGSAVADTLYLKSKTDAFPYDLLFYNSYAYTQTSTGDWTGSGNPVIFLASGAQALMVGQGVAVFNSFTYDSITPTRVSQLASDPAIDTVSTKNSKGFQVESLIRAQYAKLIIGNKFRPNVGGVFSSAADDVNQINLQPVFLVKTREGYYAKFMVTLFKGTGVDIQKMTLTWQALKK
jgi:hypothetical protein